MLQIIGAFLYSYNSQDVQVNAKLPEARRSTRTKAHAGYDISREPYMMWTNRRAVNNS